MSGLVFVSADLCGDFRRSRAELGVYPVGCLGAPDVLKRSAGRLGVAAINNVRVLPDADFGDPSHVNATGREKVTADFIARFGGRASVGMR